MKTFWPRFFLRGVNAFLRFRSLLLGRGWRRRVLEVGVFCVLLLSILYVSNQPVPTFTGKEVELPDFENGVFVEFPDFETAAPVSDSKDSVPKASIPKIALVISGLGRDEKLTQVTLATFPKEVTLSFVPYGGGLYSWFQKAQETGHEILTTLPMESTYTTQENTGPYTLLTSLSLLENLSRLKWVLSRSPDSIGCVGDMGSRFLLSQKNLEPILKELQGRKLLFLDGLNFEQDAREQLSEKLGLAYIRSDHIIDGELSRSAINHILKSLEKKAIEQGIAVGLGNAHQLTIEQVSIWLKTLPQKGIALVPISEIALRHG